MTPDDARPGVALLSADLANFRYSIFRLETLQTYSGSSEDVAFTEWQRTGIVPVTSELRAWCDRIRKRVVAGCSVRRVHVVSEPLTEYLMFELASYRPNADAGEDVRIIPVRDGQWPVDVPRADFWLVDSCRRWDMRYSADSAWLGTELVTDPLRTAEACFIRDAALAQSVSLSTYQTHQ